MQMEELDLKGDPIPFSLTAYTASLKTKEAGRKIELKGWYKIGSVTNGMIKVKSPFNKDEIISVCIYLITVFNEQKLHY